MPWRVETWQWNTLTNVLSLHGKLLPVSLAVSLAVTSVAVASVSSVALRMMHYLFFRGEHV